MPSSSTIPNSSATATHQNKDYHLEDFSENHYRLLINELKKNYEFSWYGEEKSAPHVLWRHDVDYSPQRGLRLASIEQEMGVKATYFFLFHSEYYSLMERPIVKLMRSIRDKGHRIGLHFDPCFYDDLTTPHALERRLSEEKHLLEDLAQTEISVFSYHNPTLSNLSDVDDDTLAGMINAYGKTIKTQYKYCSDSNGYWRYDCMIDVITAQPSYQKLHLLTHPVWWTPEILTPRERISRAIDGRAQVLHNAYDAFLASQHDRLNIGTR